MSVKFLSLGRGQRACVVGGGSDSFAIDLINFIKFSGKYELFENEVDAEVLR